MSWSVTFTVLPNGFDGQRLALSLVAAPRVEDSSTSLGSTPLADWPARLAELAPARLVSADGTIDLPITRTGPQADADLWRAMFPGTTVVAEPGPTAEAMPGVVAGPSVGDATRELELLYRDFAIASPEAWPDAGDGAVRRLVAVAAAPMQTFDSRADRLAAVRRLGASGRVAEAEVLGIVDVAAHVRQRSAQARVAQRAGAVGPPGGPPPIRSIEAADFHQVVGVLLGHPLISRQLGLRVDFTVPVFDGEHSIRVVGSDGEVLNGPVTRRQSFSRVHVDRASRRFVMATQPNAPTEIVDGVLDVTGATNPEAAATVVSTIDAVGLSLQIASLATTRFGGEVDAVGAVALPVTRDVGVTVARPGRGVEVAQHALARSIEVAPDKAGPDPVLFADDVTTGFRIDVAIDGGPLRSLMHRRARYTVAGDVVADEQEEGRVDALPLLADVSPNSGTPALVAGEEIWGWDGWGLGVSRPGRAVLGDKPGAPTTTPIEPEIAPGYDLHLETEVVPGTIPRLRYGNRHEFLARAVDLAGNAIDADVADRDRALDAGQYLRREPLPSPNLVPADRFSAGESAARLVTRSDGDGNPVGRGSRRHVAAPKSSQGLCELHGAFDGAIGSQSSAAERHRLLTIARRESGTFNDPTMLDADGTQVPMPGFSIVTNDPEARPRVRLPLPRGAALPNGAYAIHDTERTRHPYLPDVAAGGFALLGVPGQQEAVVVPYTGTWPDLVPAHLVVVPAPDDADPEAIGIEVRDGGQLVELSVPPAMEATIEMSTPVDPSILPQLFLGELPPKSLTNGTAPLVCRRQTVHVVHAVERPLTPPVPQAGITVTPPAEGATAVDVKSTLAVHRPSTGEVHLLAEWTDRVDPGTGDLQVTDQRQTLGSTRVEQTGGPVDLAVRHPLDHTRRVTASFTPVATTRFREYLDVVREGDPSRQRPGSAVTVTIPNRARPKAPVVQSVVPAFTWARSTTNGVYTSTRTCTGVRVALRRPWEVTGAGERLGVVVLGSSPPPGSQTHLRLTDLVTRWGADPLQESNPAGTTHLLFDRFAGYVEKRSGVVLPGAPAGSPLVDVLGYPVSFDAERDLWFADIDVTLPEDAWPFLRLGLVRYQPVSVKDCHLSPAVATEFVQLLPKRVLEARKHANHGVRVTMRGDSTLNSAFEMRQERRIPEPLDTTSDLGSSAGVAVGEGWNLTVDPEPGFGKLAELILQPVAGFTPGDTLVKELRAGRVVVDEVETGLQLRRPVPGGRRVVYTETFDRAAVGITGAST
jgi:hypothetical protein